MRHRQSYAPLAEMNLTNMIDTAFTLLIAFMLITPSIKHGLEIELPEVSSANVPSQAATTTIVIQRSRENVPEAVYIEDENVTLERLGEVIEGKMIENPGLNVVIEADRRSSYETFARVIARLQEIGMDNIGLITEPRDLEAPAAAPESEPQ